jgi:di/tricarboxylate transporter
MNLDAWITIAVITACFLTLIFSRWAADVVLMGGVTLLLVFGILTPEAALSGLANEGMVTVGVLFIVSAGLKETGAINWLTDSLLGRPTSVSNAQMRVMGPVAALSAFLNNTPVVAMLIPAINDWARKFQLSISKLLMPLSYAAIIGGTCTLIGTSTNLIVNGLLIKQMNGEGLKMFELAWIGLPATLLVFIFVLVASKWLLPERKSAITQFSDVRQYTVEMLVEPRSSLEGKSIEEAGLRQLSGLYLVEIERRGHILPAVSPKERLEGGDRLVFAGVVDSVMDLQKIRGLTPATNQVFKVNVPRPERSFIEAVISDTNAMVGKTVKEGRFRSRYNAAIIAVSRNGEQLRMKIGDIVLQVGDTLLVEAPASFAETYRNSRDFFLVSELTGSKPPRHDRALFSISILAGMVLLVATGVLSMLKGSLLAAGLMIISRCLTGNTARRAVDWQVLVVIAASFALGQALQQTGAADYLAGSILTLAGDGHPIVALAAVYFATALLTAMITNNAAAVLMFPVVLSMATTLGVSYMPFVIVLMVAASASFATPIGYQTNLMVFGPGGYHFSDYIRMGLPITILVGILCLLIVPVIWPF